MGLFDGQRANTIPHPTAGLARAVLAGVLFPILAATAAGPAAFLAAGLALAYGVLLVIGRPRALAREPLAQVLIDALLVGLLMAGTGGGESPFFALYFLVALGLIGIGDRAKAAMAAVALLGGFPVAVASANGLGALAAAPIGLRAGILAIFCAAVAHLGAGTRELAGRESALSSQLEAERDQTARIEALIPGFATALRTLSLEEILSWTVRVAYGGCGGTYAHVVVSEDNHHVSLFEGNTDACPSWWHPTIQGLVLRVRREGVAVRSEEEIHGIQGFLAVPLGQGDDVRGAVIVGGGGFGPGAERVLALISEAAVPALEAAREAPGGRDPVTGLPNRVSLHRILRREIPRGRTLTVFAAELDGLEQYNRARGFAAGDDLLRRIGEGLGGGRRAFRNGGNGFVVVVSGTDAARARRTALSIRRVIYEEAGDLVRPAVGFAHVGEGLHDPDFLLRAALDAAREGDGGARTEEPGTTRGIVEALLGALEAKDPGIGEHLRGVSGVSQDIARRMGLSEEQMEALIPGALLHDVGKIGIPDHILHKPGLLTGEEYEVIKRHPSLGAGIISPIMELGAALPVVSYHHERFDGNGYPDGLRGEDIPLAARIVAVADAFDSMVRGRPYGYGVPLEAALREIEANSGTQFDPAVVRAVREVLGGDRPADEDHSFG